MEEIFQSISPRWYTIQVQASLSRLHGNVLARADAPRIVQVLLPTSDDIFIIDIAVPVDLCVIEGDRRVDDDGIHSCFIHEPCITQGEVPLPLFSRCRLPASFSILHRTRLAAQDKMRLLHQHFMFPVLLQAFACSISYSQQSHLQLRAVVS